VRYAAPNTGRFIMFSGACDLHPTIVVPFGCGIV
jgi:hypothetical protein